MLVLLKHVHGKQTGIVSIYEVPDRIGLNIKKLLAANSFGK